MEMSCQLQMLILENIAEIKTGKKIIIIIIKKKVRLRPTDPPFDKLPRTIENSLKKYIQRLNILLNAFRLWVMHRTADPVAGAARSATKV